MAGSLQVLVMTDVEGSTRLWAEHPGAMPDAMRRHHEIVHRAIAEAGGRRPVDQGEGDAVFAAFDSAVAAVAAVLRFQRELASEQWPEGIALRDRVGIHSGEVAERDGNLFGPTVNRAARLRGLGHGGQTLLSAPVYEVLRDALPADVELVDLGEHRMKDLTRPEHVWQLTAPDLPSDFPPLGGLNRARHNLPVQPTPFIGREREVAEVVELLQRHRLVTVLAFGGMGKTRLALQVAAELADGDGDGVWFVDLSSVTEASAVAPTITALLEVPEGDDPAASLVAWLQDKRLLLVLDNLEQLLPEAAQVVARIAAAGPGVHLLATSREALRVRAEQSYELAPLPVPAVPSSASRVTEADLGRLSTYAAVSLFLARAAAARRDFVLTAANAAAVAAVCSRLDGLPLALELAAARLRVLSPEALLDRLERALSVLTGGSRDLPNRHQTLRAAIAWSYDTLPEELQRLLDALSVFAGPFTLDAAEAVVGDGEVDPLDGVTDLVDRSLLRVLANDDGDRFAMLVPIREFAAERLAGRPAAASAARDRHLTWVTTGCARSADYSLADYNRTQSFVAENLLEVRPAVDWARSRGRTEAEIEVVAVAASTLFSLHRLLEMADLLDHALEHHTEKIPARLDFKLRLWTANLLIHRKRFTAAREVVAKATNLATAITDTSYRTIALLLTAETAGEPTAAHAALGESERTIAELPERGNDFPRWMLDEYLLTMATWWDYFEPARTEERLREAAASADSLSWAYALYNLAYFLTLTRSIADARAARELALEVRGRDDDAIAPILPYVDEAIADFSLMLGDLASAQRALLLPYPHDLSEDSVATRRVLTAAIERGQGRALDGLEHLRDLLSAEHLSEEHRHAAVHLLAVLHRELGQPTEATTILTSEWPSVLGSGSGVFGLLPVFLAEAAMLSQAHSPEYAARLIAPLTVRRWRTVSGVHYDLDRLLDGLREQIGPDRVDAIVSEHASGPYPDHLL